MLIFELSIVAEIYIFLINSSIIGAGNIKAMPLMSGKSCFPFCFYHSFILNSKREITHWRSLFYCLGA